LPSHPLNEIVGGYAKENFEILTKLFNNQASASIEDCVLMNTSALLFVADKVKDFKEGVNLARQFLKNGKAKEVFEEYIRYSNSI
jgi:anthranilate phosphoribosyltransferase